MKPTYLKIFIVLILLSATAFLYLFFQQKDDAIHIALVAPLSGDSARAGAEHLNGVSLYIDRINKAGGIHNRRIVLDVHDDRNRKELARESALAIAEAGRAVAVIGHNYSSCSIAGGAVYRKAQIPAISPSSTDALVTLNNEWYFRTVPSGDLQARFLANYAHKVLGNDAIMIIQENLPFGARMAEIFAETSAEAGVRIARNWQFHVDDEQLDRTLERIVQELKETDSRAIVFLAVHAPEGVRLVRLMKDYGVKNPIITPDSFASRSFLESVARFPRERANPGYYTNGIYVASPFIFDTASEEAQEFRALYTKKYGEEPGWHAAYAYDAAMVLVEALKNELMTGRAGSIREVRYRIREYLESLTSPRRAISGITGLNYFDESGNAQKPFSIGRYKNDNMISALVQLQIVDSPEEISDPAEAVSRGEIVVIDDQYLYKTNVAYTGIKLNEISGLDADEQTYTLDFDLWFRYQGDFDAANITFPKAVAPVSITGPLEKRTIQGLTYQLYQVKGTFKADYLLYRSFEGRVLRISFYHNNLTRDNLIYVPDIIGMESEDEEEYLARINDSQLLKFDFDWLISSISFYQDTVTEEIRGNPRFLEYRNRKPVYSQFNMDIAIEKDQFIPGRLVAPHIAAYIVLFCFFTILLSLFSRRNRFLVPFPKIIWLLQLILTITLLFCAEIFVISQLAEERLSYYYLEQVILFFSVLWWFVPAFFLHLAVEHFFWRPLERNAELTVPIFARRFVSFNIFLIAFFAVIAFVFDREITSLLATSGVAAMIIGLAIQINIANIFSGIALNLERPFKLGDWVEIGSYTEGQVIDITWRTTRLMTMADCVLSIPNSEVTNNAVYNFHYPDDRYWLWFPVHVDPIHSPDKVQKVIMDALIETEEVLKDAGPIVRLEFTDWSVAYYPIFLLKNRGKRAAHKNEVTKAIWKHLNRAGITPAVKRQEVRISRGRADRDISLFKPIDFLEEIDIFKPFSEENKTFLKGRMKAHHYTSGQKIIDQGETGDSLFIVIEGVVSVRIWYGDDIGNNMIKKVRRVGRGGAAEIEDITDTRDAVEVARLGAGNIFGEMALLTGEKRTATIVCITDAYLLELRKEALAPVFAEQPQLAAELSEILAARQRDIDSKRESNRVTREEENAMKNNLLRKIRQFFNL